MNIKVICLGKTKDNFISKGIAEYQKRIGRYGKLSWTILADVKLTGSNSVEIVKEKEAEIILKKIHSRDFVIALDERGKQFSSPNFAKYLERISVNGKSITFIIGGVYGLAENVRQRADLILSFSEFTFTHQMIRMLLAEQIYRAFTIIKGKKYHY